MEIRKKIFLGGLMLLLIVFSGCSFGKNVSDNTSKETANQENQKTEGSIKDSLTNLLTTGAGMKCTVEDETGKYTIYAKSDKMKMEGFPYSQPMEGTDKGTEGKMINDGTWVYMWGGKEGMKFNIKEMEALSPTEQKKEDFSMKASDWKDWIKDMDQSGAKYDCRPTALSDNDFTPPADVKFQDWGEFMKGMVEWGKKMEQSGNAPQDIPQGIPLPE